LNSQLQIVWNRIWRLFLKTFNFVPGVPGLLWDLSFYHLVLIVNPTWPEFWFVENVLEIISRFCATLSAIGCIDSVRAFPAGFNLKLLLSGVAFWRGYDFIFNIYIYICKLYISIFSISTYMYT